MKILDAGTENISNMDVLHWIRSKRTQHAAEDAEDKKNDADNQKNSTNNKPPWRPRNFLSALEKHERELASNKYPYTRNPSAYNGTYTAMQRFDSLLTERLCFPLEERYRGLGMSGEELERTLGKEQEEKALTETEMLMVFNHAPGCVEQLQPMIEGVEERFTVEEQGVIVETVVEVYRGDEPRVVGGEVVEEGGDVGVGAQVGVDGEMEGEQKGSEAQHDEAGSLSPWSKRAPSSDVHFQPDLDDLGPSPFRWEKGKPWASYKNRQGERTASKSNKVPVGQPDRMGL